MEVMRTRAAGSAPAPWFGRASLLAAGALLLCLGVAAAEDDAPEGGAGMPAHTGKHTVSAAIGQKGARLSLKNGWSLLLPSGLPIGNSRLLTLKVSRRRAKGKEIADGFVPMGPTVEFDGAINATESPLLAMYEAKRFRQRRGHRLVLASEYGGFCEGERVGRKLGGGLCAQWRLVDATLDKTAGQLRAKLELPGGHRLQFGSVPEPKPEEE